jgi:hypothetical protein
LSFENKQNHWKRANVVITFQITAICVVAAVVIAAPASAKDLRGGDKRIHYARQPALQESWASNRWGWAPYHWRFGDHYFDGI